MITAKKMHKNFGVVFKGTSAEMDAAIKQHIYSPTEGDLWYDTENNELMKYTGAAWAAVVTQQITQGAALVDSTASDVAGVVADLNIVVAELRATGVLASPA